ncbi:HNH endonuclease signature motif containing protein [Streptomyces sp. enrichment culture]|uniref:HNH endonuclease signature motif containing protein n=1 Tax=Streptomyces sp. enrichment culture TaxID=1795815 RepID=UPI003F57E36A
MTVSQDGDCWLWTGQSTHGYGTFGLGQRKLRAHRWIYEQMRTEIPPGLHLDHLCRKSLCVNPWHLEPVTNRVNVLRGSSPLARQAAQKSCKHGHEFTTENTYVDPRGHRSCRTCQRAKDARRREKRRKSA